MLHRNLRASNILLNSHGTAMVHNSFSRFNNHHLLLQISGFGLSISFRQQFVHELYGQKRSFVTDRMDAARIDCRSSIFRKKRCVSSRNLGENIIHLLPFFSWSFGILLYEVLTLGKEPYESIGGDDDKKEALIEFLKSGKRLSKPELAAENVYEFIMLFD